MNAASDNVMDLIWRLVDKARALPAQPGRSLTPQVQRDLVEMRELGVRIGRPTLVRTQMPDYADPVTLAYIAIGAANELTEMRKLAPKRVDEVYDEHNGQAGVVEELIIHARELDRAGDAHPSESFGCWAYSVAEEYGARMARALVAGVEVDRAAVMKEILDAAADDQ
jgi:hypothetical protein